MAESPFPPSPPTGGAAPLNVLVADDDVSTRQFLAAALKSLGYVPALAADGCEALEKASHDRFDALLLDCRMPGAGAEDVLASLRADVAAASRHAAAFATSAEVTPDRRRHLLDAGFMSVIEKPCRVATLDLALRHLDRFAPSAKVLDDDEALAATGDTNTMRALRGLLRDELAGLDAGLGDYAERPEELIDRLHRLRSACGFCGAARLGAQVKQFQHDIDERKRVEEESLHRFRRELRATMAALAAMSR